MAIARVSDGVILEERTIDINDVPEHKRALWRPIVVEGSGENVNHIIEDSQVRRVYSVSPSQIVAERERRLSLGFDYDFQDVRGVHHIGTTPADMVGWREVIDYANALVDLGDTDTQIAIVTDTGPALVTAPEWQAVMLHAATVRQSIWAKSFVLQATSPIPSDYANDSYWT